MSERETYQKLIQEALDTGNFETIRKMLTNGVDLGVYFRKEKKLLTSERENIDKEILEFLITSKSKINEFNENGRTYAHYVAANASNPELIDLLIEQGGSINISDTNLGCKPLHFACMLNNKKIVEKIISCGVDINEKDNRGNTPLFFAAFNHENGVEIIKFLYNSHIDINVENKNMETPLHYALKINMPSCIIKALLDIGLDANKIDKYGYSPVYWTAIYGNIASMKALIDATGYPSENDICELFRILMDSANKDFMAEVQSSSPRFQ